MRSKWRKPASFHPHRTGLLLTSPSRVTRRTRRSRTLHRAPRCRATIAQSRRHAQLATLAINDVVTSTLRVRALLRVTGASSFPATPPRRKLLRRDLTLGQARHTAPLRSSTHQTLRTRLTKPTCTIVRRVSQQPPLVFNNYKQPQQYQNTPRPKFGQLRGLQPPNGAPTLNCHGVPPLVSTFS